MKRHPLRNAIVAGLEPGGAAQQAGGGDNSLQPARGLLRRSGQESAHPSPEPDDGPCHVSGPATSEEDDTLVGGALPGETDYLDAHDLIDWEQAPFAALAWAIGRAAATPANPDPAPIARWLWTRDGKVTGTLAPTFGVILHPGRGMTLRRPSADEPSALARVGLVVP